MHYRRHRSPRQAEREVGKTLTRRPEPEVQSIGQTCDSKVRVQKDTIAVSLSRSEYKAGLERFYALLGPESRLYQLIALKVLCCSEFFNPSIDTLLLK